MDFQFIIPCSNLDLLNSEGHNYYVKGVFEPNEIPDLLKSCKNAVLQKDPFYIFDHFDVYFSVIENSSNLSPINLTRTFDLLYLTLDTLGNELLQFLENGQGQIGRDRSSYLNLTKMTLYLYVNVVKCIERVANDNTQGQTKKGKKTSDSIETFPDWDQKRYKFLVQMHNISQISLEKLWDPPIAEENFTNLICDICYRMLEAHNSKGKHIGDTIFQILGYAIKKYNHGISFPVKILQILRTVETTAPVIANGIFLLSEEYGITSVFGVLIREIVETLTVDSADTAISKNFSSFLIELGTVSPKLIIPHLSTLGDELLNCDSHILRNSILQIMGDAIVSELTSEDLCEDSKAIRDEFLENLLAHVNDVSSHVRSKVLQIWCHMKEQGAVPLSYETKVLPEAVDRLDDKTATVRKYAVLLVKAFLERNPYSAKLSLAELIKKHDEESAKMEELQAVLDEERNKAKELDEDWEQVIPDLLPFVQESVQASPLKDKTTEENYDELIQTISNFLLEKNYKSAVMLVRKADFVAGNSELRLTLNQEEQCLYYMALLKSYLFLAKGCKDSREEFGTKIKTVQFLQDSIKFSKVIAKAVPKIQNMLQSKMNSDVFEAVDFFTTGYLFGIRGTEEGMRRMLYLVWSADKEKADAVSNAYKKVLFTTDLTGRAHALKVVQNLSAFIEDLSTGHYSAFEVLMKEWVFTEDIDLVIIQLLFEKFTMKLEGTIEIEALQALQLLIMASSAKSSIATANIAVIETIAFGERGLKDSRIFTGCLEFFLNSIDSTMNSKYYIRYEQDDPLIKQVIDSYKRFFFHPKTPNFDKVSTKTIEFIYQLCQAPDVICQQLLALIHTKMNSVVEKLKEMRNGELSQHSQEEDLTESQILASQRSENPSRQRIKLPTFLITRFIFAVGFISMKEMIFLDIDVYNNMKWRDELKEEKSKKKGLLYNKRKTLNLDMSASGSLKRLSCSAAEPQQEPDEELVGATAEDSIAELIQHICEEVLPFAENGILSKFIPFIIEICKYPSLYRDDHLQQAATLALLRIMALSSRFCEDQMPFLMNILNMTKNTKIKCNIIIGLSDLTFRFPNIIEPWTGHFYSTLHETNVEIRLTAVKMLSHLILYEMIRVKGQIADLALCIVDDDEEIKAITHRFFREIANNSNILYNVLPDIISKLSDINLNLEEEKYHVIMRYILSLIQKDRQVETLVDKLCQRFRNTTVERQWRDIAYCLSLLNYTEKTIKKLSDNMQHYKDKVQIDEIYQSFKLIIANSSKLAKPEMKAAITEFETRLNECLNVRDEEEVGSGAELPVTQTQRQTQSKKTQKGELKKKLPRKNKRGKTSSSSDESDEESNEESEKESRTRRKDKSPKKNKGKKVTRVIEDSSSSEEEESIPQKKRGRSRK